jgi:hypothetical protein
VENARVVLNTSKGKILFKGTARLADNYLITRIMVILWRIRSRDNAVRGL